MNANTQVEIILQNPYEAQLFFHFCVDEMADVRTIELRNFDMAHAQLILQFIIRHKEHFTHLESLSVHACRINKNFMLQIEELRRAWRLLDLEYSCFGLDNEMAEVVPQLLGKDRVSLHQIMTSKINMEKLLKIATEFRSIYF